MERASKGKSKIFLSSPLSKEKPKVRNDTKKSIL
jgi:hypothetical protein